MSIFVCLCVHFSSSCVVFCLPHVHFFGPGTQSAQMLGGSEEGRWWGEDRHGEYMTLGSRSDLRYLFDYQGQAPSAYCMVTLVLVCIHVVHLGGRHKIMGCEFSMGDLWSRKILYVFVSVFVFVCVCVFVFCVCVRSLCDCVVACLCRVWVYRQAFK